MPLTRLQLKNRLKSSRGLTRNREDGLLPDDLIHEAIEEAIIRVGIDCGLLQVDYAFALEADEWRYAIPEDMFELRSIFYVNSSGNRRPIAVIDHETFKAGRNPETDTSTDPSYVAFPIYASRILEPFGRARPLHDFVRRSHITATHIRTVEDTGINLGRTRDGTRISPGDLVRNLSTNAFGYIEYMDIITTKRAGAAGATTSSTQLVIGGGDFVADGIAEDDIICVTSGGIVVTYAFVTEVVDAITLYYEAVRGEGTEIEPGDAITIGVAQKIILTRLPPHRGLREGSSAGFTLGAATATMNATVFTDTRCTGSSPAGAAVDEVAIAAGGSHGVITAVETNYIDVVEWIGGNPVDGEVVTIQSSDEYQVESRPHIEPMMMVGPTPSVSDDPGERSMEAIFIKSPFIPTEDWQFIDIPDRYREVLNKCVEWQCVVLAGNKSLKEKAQYQQFYETEAAKFAGDMERPPKGGIMTPMGNRRPRVVDRANTTRSGITYDVTPLL